MLQNSMGEKMRSKILVKGALNTIDISNLPNGLYFISIKGKNTFNSKFLKN